MRALVLLTALAVAGSALAALAPTAAAAAQACTSLASTSCPGLACKDEDGDRAYAYHECAHPEDHLDPCAFQSDCCGGVWGNGFWCPEDS